MSHLCISSLSHFISGYLKRPCQQSNWWANLGHCIMTHGQCIPWSCYHWYTSIAIKWVTYRNLLTIGRTLCKLSGGSASWGHAGRKGKQTSVNSGQSESQPFPRWKESSVINWSESCWSISSKTGAISGGQHWSLLLIEWTFSHDKGWIDLDVEVGAHL